MLPPLRQDLSLHPGPAAEDGAPTWTLHDPAANRFYRLSWPAFEMLARWPLNDARAVVTAVNRDTTLHVDEHDLAALIEFLTQHHLVDARGPVDGARLLAAARGAKLSAAKWLLKNYLFLRIPLVRPAPWLDRLAPYVRWAFDRRFWIGIALTALLGLYLASRQWDAFLHTFAGYKTLGGLIAIGIALSFAKVLHELGHAFTAQHFGCRVPTMGVAFLVLWPVLYTDTNEAWKIQSKRPRLAIGAAGMLAELALAAVATLAWSFLPDGPLRAGAFLLATTTWLLTLALNVSPFMRFDGYFLLSDWLDMPNLHSRAFALGRWWLRRRLFGWDDPPPEAYSTRRRRFLIAFALGTWLYRLTLFLGIAFLVYHVFFKLLGIFLLMVELGWFIALPIWNEMRVWYARRGELGWNRATRRTAIVAALLLAFVFVPWRSDVRAPAVAGAADAQGLYAVAAARVVSAPVPVGATVAAGQVLVELSSPDLAYRLAQAQSRARELRWQLDRQPLHDQLLQEGSALKERWAEAQTQAAGLAAQMRQLIVRAPFAGRVVEVDDALVPGAWVARREKLFYLIGAHGTEVDVFVGEADARRLRPDTAATFVATAPERPRLTCRVGTIDRVNAATLDSLYVVSTYGGPIPVRRDRGGSLVPVETVFRVRLDDCASATAPTHEWRGTAHLRGEWHSIAGRLLRRATTVLQRESGF